MVEFAFASLFLVPMLLGTINLGMNMTRSIQVTQVSRDAGHMFVRFVDFSQPANQDIIVRLAYGLGMTRDGGNGKVVLTRVMFIGDDECAAGGLTTAQCTNHSQPVITQQIIIGDDLLRTASFGEVPSNYLNAKGEVAQNDYLTDINTRAVGFQPLLALQPGEFAYVAEAYFEAPEYDFPGFFESGRLYARTIF